MKALKDKKIVALIIVLVMFTIGYFTVVFNVSYALNDSYNVDANYDKLIEIIKKCSVAYAKKNSNLFKKDNIVYIKVQDLIDNKLLIPDQDGNIVNPLNENVTINDNIIKIKFEDNEYTVSVDS